MDSVIRGKRLYMFQFADGWAPAELTNDDEARRVAEQIEGTLRVENLDGTQTIWERENLV